MSVRLLPGIVGVGVLAPAGCHQRVEQDGGVVFSFQLWVPILVLLGGIAALPAGILMFLRGRRLWGAILAVGGPIAAVVVAPGLLMDKVVVNREGFYSRHGFWWNPTIHDVRFQELARVDVGYEVKRGRRGRKNVSYYFDCAYKSGQRERVPLGDNMREALSEIVQQFQANDVMVIVPNKLPEE